MTKNRNKTIKEFIEKGAALEHERWSGWQAYLFSKSEWTKDGYLIPKELCERWQRQIDTPYEKLSEQEKESDRKEVRKYLPLIEKIIKSLQEEIDYLKNELEIADGKWRFYEPYYKKAKEKEVEKEFYDQKAKNN